MLFLQRLAQANFADWLLDFVDYAGERLLHMEQPAETQITLRVISVLVRS